MLPVARGIAVTKIHIVLYIPRFHGGDPRLVPGRLRRLRLLLVAVAVSLWWLAIALTGYWTADDRVWARKLFAFSIVAITALSVMMSIDFQVAPATHLVASLF